jgi:hypothetical protein
MTHLHRGWATSGAHVQLGNVEEHGLGVHQLSETLTAQHAGGLLGSRPDDAEVEPLQVVGLSDRNAGLGQFDDHNVPLSVRFTAGLHRHEVTR